MVCPVFMTLGWRDKRKRMKVITVDGQGSWRMEYESGMIIRMGTCYS